MARIVELTTRETHKYVDSYSHLDKWSSEGILVKQLRRKVYDAWAGALRDRRDVGDGDGGKNGDYIGMEEDGRSHLNFIVLSPLPKKRREQRMFLKQLQQAIYDNLSYSGCAHTYDCCGCPSASVREVRRVGRHEWHVEISHSRNY